MHVLLETSRVCWAALQGVFCARSTYYCLAGTTSGVLGDSAGAEAMGTKGGGQRLQQKSKGRRVRLNPAGLVIPSLR